MPQTYTLPLQAWMTAKGTRRLIAVLSDAGGSVRFVGGCVRDAILGREVKDIDLATPLRPEDVLQALKKAGITAIPTGMQHGTITAVINHRPFEITTLRRDIETFGRHAIVEFTEDWQSDAGRRDLTINAMFCAPDGTVYDYFNGWEDLQEGRIRFVGDPAQRIEEDYLRILRFFRFHAYYGEVEPDPAGLQAARLAAPHLKELSAERIRSELLRLMMAPDPTNTLDIMITTGILAPVLPEAVDTYLLKKYMTIKDLVARYLEKEAILRLALLIAPTSDGAGIARRLKLSNRESEYLSFLFSTRMQAHNLLEDTPLLRLIQYRKGKPKAMARLVYSFLDGDFDPQAHADMKALTAAVEQVHTWDVPRFPLSGKDLKSLGVTPGPVMGAVLKAVEAWWIECNFKPGHEACLEEAKKQIAFLQNKA